jgi:hypothetical protein
MREHSVSRSRPGIHWQPRRIAKRSGKNPARSAVARKILIACWHILSRQQPFKPARSQTSGATDVSASSRSFQAA